jgi:hypothetical protein
MNNKAFFEHLGAAQAGMFAFFMTKRLMDYFRVFGL